MCFAHPPEVSFAFLILVTFFAIKCDLMASTSIKQGNWCTCLDSEEARNISSSGKPHVHCSCSLCKGKAVYPMTAWRHVQRANRATTETLDNKLPVPSTSSSEVLDRQIAGLLELEVFSSLKTWYITLARTSICFY